MKKIFLIPLMAMLCTVMAWADPTVRTAGTLSELQDALSNAAANDEIQLTADIALPSDHSVYLNIKKSITLDGQGHTLSGYGNRGSAQQTIAINYSNSEKISVVLKNLNITTPGLRPIDTRGNLISLELDNVNIVSTASGNAQGITFSCDAGADASIANLIIKNSSINATASGYPIIFWNPANVIAENSTFAGYCGLYFKNGSRGSVVNADACDFDCPNVHSGVSNAFSCFPLEDDGITLNLHNCGMNIEQIGDQNQALVTTNNNNTSRREQPINITISGDNSHFNTKGGYNMTIQNLYLQGSYKYQPYGEINVTITGGTYSVNPEAMYYYDQWVPVEEGNPTRVTLKGVTIPEGYEVKEITMEGVATPLYRVVKSAAEKEPGVMYDLNDLVAGEGVDEGNNPVSSFDLSTGTDMTLNQETTTAGYVQVKDNATEGATTVTIGTPSQDQTLVINNGLDVQGESQVIVQAGSTLEIGEGGINTEQPSNIVIGADENGAASLIMDPTITVNQTPNLTVKMKAKQIGWIMASGKEYYWHRFALPIQQASTWVKNPNKSTYVFGWNYSTNDWEQLSALTQMVPFQGYTLSADYENLGDVEYTFTGQLAGNTNNALNFQRNGFNFFGNSYTGYIDILALVDQIMDDNKIDGTVWMWYQENQSYVAIPLQALRDNPYSFDSWMREVAPMQTFILKQNGSVNASTELNYASAIWGNPRYGHNTSSPAPQRIQNDETARMRIIVKADNGKSDFVMLTEDGRFSDAFEKGYDGEKYMNENALNMYATVNDVDYTAVATDNLAGKALTLNTVESVNYTMLFAKVNGEAYAIRDLMTNIITPITEGNTYTFAAQPNTTIEGRFVIVPMQNMPTDVETVETTPAVKGIYTIMGQYVGEDFDILPAGIYVVDGVKIVK